MSTSSQSSISSDSTFTTIESDNSENATSNITDTSTSQLSVLDSSNVPSSKTLSIVSFSSANSPKSNTSLNNLDEFKVIDNQIAYINLNNDELIQINGMLVDVTTADKNYIAIVYLPFLKMCKELIINNLIELNKSLYSSTKVYEKLTKLKGRECSCCIKVYKEKTNTFVKTDFNLISINNI